MSSIRRDTMGADDADQHDHGTHTRVSDGQLAAFGAALETLKQHGCTLFVVGDLSPADHRYAARQMLGQATGATRHCLCVYTAADPATLTHPVQASFTNQGRVGVVLNWAGHSRSDSWSIATQLESTAVPDICLPHGDVSELTQWIADAIDAIKMDVGGFEPAELRVWVEAIDPIISNADSQAELDAFLSQGIAEWGSCSSAQSRQANRHRHSKTGLMRLSNCGRMREHWNSGGD